jgi:hypothetical protein
VKAGGEATLKFSDAGHPIFPYVTRTGALSLELKKKGDSVKFIPPGGGVGEVTVTEVTVTRTGFRYTLKMSEEHTEREVLTQRWATLTVEGTLSRGELNVTIKLTTKGARSTVDGVLPFKEVTATGKGKFERE